MKLYLVRHGKAETGPDEVSRPLSDRGRADIEALADHLAEQQIKVAQVFHSGLARAQETAEILGAALAPGASPEYLEGIRPMDDPSALHARLADWDADTMVCGHEPFMGAMASELMCGDANLDTVTVKTGTVFCFQNDTWDKRWRLQWMVRPRIVRGPKPATKGG